MKNTFDPAKDLEHFNSLSAVVFEKDNLRRNNDEWLVRQAELREFYNGRPIMTDDDADEENLDKITNHLIGYSNMQVTETRMYSMWSTSNKLIDIDVLVGDPEVREDQSAQIVKYLNKAIYKTTRFGAFWRSVCGEVSLAGRAACIHKEDSDWCPSLASKILLPDSVGTDASELTYAFTPRELTYTQLQKMLDGEDNKDEDEDLEDDDDSPDVGNEVYVNSKIVKELMATIEEQIQDTGGQSTTGTESEKHELTNSDRAPQKNRTTVNLWYHYQVRFDSDLEKKVVDLLIFTDDLRSRDAEQEKPTKGDQVPPTPAQEVVAFYPAYYDSPSEWLHLIVIDSTIGGDKRFSTAKGIAEITYNSDLDSEELLNRIFTGEKMRAIPRFQKGAETDDDKLLGWNPTDSNLVPQGISEFNFRGGTGGLQNPLSLLQQNSSRQSGAGHSNSSRDGELRTQSLERQANSQATTSSRTSDLFKSMEIIAHEMVRRFFVGKIEGGSPGYEEIMWFRKQMKARDIDLEVLAEQSFGFYDNIEVKIVKSSSTGEIDQDVAVAEQLMKNLGNYPAAVRPLIVKRFTTLLTGDPDFSDHLVELLPKVVSAQRVTAESEFEQIARDASIGVETPLGADDIHQEHATIHNKHLRVVLNRSLLRPWNREDAAHFAGIQLHQQKHIDEMMLNDTSRAEGEFLLREFEDLVAEGDKLLTSVSKAELEASGESEQEIERKLKIMEQQRKERETLIKEADTRSVIEQRARRQADVRRKGDQQFIIQSMNASRDTNQ